MASNPKPAGGVAQEPPLQGLEAVERLRSVPPPHFLSPSPDLSRLAREAAGHLFSLLLPFGAKSLPLDCLLADESFDAEQIWQQIELQSRPLVSAIRRDVRRLEKMGPEELLGVEAVREEKREGKEERDLDTENQGDDDGDNGGVGEEEEEEGDGTEEDEEDGDEGEAERDGGLKRLEDLEEGDEDGEEDDEGSEQEGEDEDDYDEDEYLIENEYYPVGDGREDKESEDILHAKYDDFFVNKNKKSSQSGHRKKIHQSSKKLELDSEENESHGESDAGAHQTDDEDFSSQNNETLSRHEKQRKELQYKIEQMEKENLGPKPWTMLGEVTAAVRPKNSALEVDLDFEHNKGRPPITAEENTVEIEDIIVKRIREGHLDEVQRAPRLPSKAPKELKELDDNKSRKGLAEIYEDEYAQKTGLVAAPLSFSDEQKKEASLLFKKLCLKLDALSHFHFAPKPVVEDMSVQVNIPALAMEEVAPLAVSDAAMLAPEEIFSGKVDFKEETELTQADRKRRRAKKKRKFKAEAAKRVAKKARGDVNMNRKNGEEES